MFEWSSSDKIAIPVLVIVVASVSILLHFCLKNKSEKIKHIPLIAISAMLIVLEIAKQSYLLVTKQYQLHHIPIHFCSLIVVLIALSEFLPRKVAKFFDVPSIVFPILTFCLLIVNPNSLIGGSSGKIFDNFLYFHAFMFHALVIAYPFIKLVLVKIDYGFKPCISLVTCIAFYASYAIPLSFVLNKNFMNILWNAFAPLENFRIAYGQVIYEIVWFALCILLSIVVYLALFALNKIINKRRNKNDT